ncbi:efflux RND transporter periplasmic adaptor subunit [Legionella resiliens]|uniref:HlyD family efflux transporter periplasmic adaptor subunit n=1 Tax=Legionella resiliens TaxID=2905958 RepID=A0ABS8X564_9GAMM|nr:MULTISPECIES: HlyD family efflux transporter periplasmic adaptor subunit [unclassified Legionella]MCE0723344.1 HlyD family efflux transporter periplasmic adaptor subunit [Legionella sp. 9fVS26]MCE3532497.1 HlyD family efflux transporter periplasmic adaptor subunit [Legionella sp. 8cVS16]
MKRKIIGGSFLLLLIIGLCSSFLLSRKMITAQNISVPVAAIEEIIAPAILDSGNDMTHVPSIQSGIVKKINVTVGQMVKKGEILFSLDDTIGLHNVTVSKIALQQAENNFMIQTKNLKHAQSQLKRLKSIDKRALNPAELREKEYEVKMGRIQIKQLQNSLDAAKANLRNAKLALNQFYIASPKNGIVLQINAHVDEFVGAGSQVILLGDAQKVIVRVSIEERDAKKYSPEASVYLTGDKLKIPLTFIQLDRYIITNDRLNARVQEALYFFDRKDYPDLAAGRQFDAHIAVKKKT